MGTTLAAVAISRLRRGCRSWGGRDYVMGHPIEDDVAKDTYIMLMGGG